jgi:hypothetical protein
MVYTGECIGCAIIVAGLGNAVTLLFSVAMAAVEDKATPRARTLERAVVATIF